MNTRFMLTVFLFAFLTSNFGQVGIDTRNPPASAMVDVDATNKGFLIPPTTSGQRSALVSPETQALDADQILQVILADFATSLGTNNGFKIVMLDSYTDLVDKRYTFNNVNFVAGGKPEIVLNNGVMLAFWRMDISANKAHIEFYYTDSKAQSTHHEYLLTKENAVWRK